MISNDDGDCLRKEQQEDRFLGRREVATWPPTGADAFIPPPAPERWHLDRFGTLVIGPGCTIVAELPTYRRDDKTARDAVLIALAPEMRDLLRELRFTCPPAELGTPYCRALEWMIDVIERAEGRV